MMQAGLGAFAPQGVQAVGAAPPMPPVPTQPGGVAPLPDRLKQLIEESRIVKRINAERAGRGQMAGAQAAQGMPTVKEQIDRALGATRYGFAGGGIVAFADGGDLGFTGGGSVGTQEEADRKRILGLLEQAGYGAQNLAAAGIDVLTLPVRALAGIYNTVIRAPRAFGADIPFIPAAAGTESMTPVMDALTLSRATTAVEPPMGQPGGAFRGNRADMPSATAVTQPVIPAAQPAATTPAAQPATSAGATPGVQPPPAAQPDGLGDAFNAYRREQEALAELLRGQGTTPPEVLEARRQYDEATSGMLKGEEDALAEMEAAAQQGMFDNPEVLAGILAGMQGTDRLGETLLGAATGAARGRASQKKAVAEAKKDLNKLRRELAMKQAELQLARKEGDVNRARAAAVDVQKIKVAIEDKAVEQRLKEMDAETRRIAAEATRDRPTTGQITPAVRANAIRQAISSVDKGKIEEKLRTNVSYLRASPAEKARMLAVEKVDAVVRQLAGYGVTPDEVAAMYNAPIASAPTGGSADPLGIR